MSEETLNIEQVGQAGLDYLLEMSPIYSSAGESIGYMARDIRKALIDGDSLSSIEQKTRKSIMEHTKGDYQKVELAALDELISGIKKAEWRSKRKKYELTREVRNIENDGKKHTLHRIRAARDISAIGIKAGDLGGFIEDENNLSHNGNCWVGGEAMVFNNAFVEENAVVQNSVKVYDAAYIAGSAIVKDFADVRGDGGVPGGSARVDENAVVSGQAIISGDVEIGGHSQISGNAVVFGYVDLSKNGNKSLLLGNIKISDEAWVENCSIFGNQVTISENVHLKDCELDGNVKILGSSCIHNSIIIDDAYVCCNRQEGEKAREPHIIDSNISGKARVSGCPKLLDVKMTDRARIEDEARVEHSVLKGNVLICGKAKVSNRSINDGVITKSPVIQKSQKKERKKSNGRV